MVDRVHQHRNTEHVRKQDKFLPRVAAHLPSTGQKRDCNLPLCLGELDIANETMEVIDQRLHNGTKTSIRSIAHPREDRFDRVLFIQVL